MTTTVLLDTSFLIALVDARQPHHDVAGQYYRHMLEQQMLMYVSVIVAAEFGMQQPVTDLPLKNFRILPFNLQHAMEASSLARQTQLDIQWMQDEIKLIAQAKQESVAFILLDVDTHLSHVCTTLRSTGAVNTRSIKLSDGFDPSALREDGQRGLGL